MTCIAVHRDSKRVWMASDSQANFGGSIATLGQKKIIRKGPLLIAFCGGLDAHDAVRFQLEPPAASRIAVAGLDGYLGREFVPWLWRELAGRERLEKQDGRALLGNQGVVAFRNEFRIVDSAGSIIRVERPGWAIGSGGAEARGALCAMQRGRRMRPRDMVVRAIAVACECDDGCSLPIDVEHT